MKKTIEDPKIKEEFIPNYTITELNLNLPIMLKSNQYKIYKNTQ